MLDFEQIFGAGNGAALPDDLRSRWTERRHGGSVPNCCVGPSQVARSARYMPDARRKESPPEAGACRACGEAADQFFLANWSMLAGRHELEGNVDLLVDLLARGERQRRIDRALALAGGVLEHGDLEIARLHRGERILRGVDAADDRLLGVDAC